MVSLFQFQSHSELFQPALRCLSSGSSGRYVVANRAFRAGEEFFSELPYALCPRQPHVGRHGCNVGEALTCLACMRSFTVPRDALVACSSCGTAFCSPQCMEEHRDLHRSTRECEAFEVARALRGFVPREDLDTFHTVLAVLTRAKAEGFTSELLREAGEGTSPVGSDNIETVGATPSDVCWLQTELDQIYASHLVAVSTSYGASSFCAAPSESAAVSVSSTPPPTVASHTSPPFLLMQALVTNVSITDPEIVSDYVALHLIYSRALRRARGLPPRLRDVLPAVSRDVFVRLCCAFQCNGFGVWTARGAQAAAGFYPGCSFFNHSCSPNIARRQNGRRVVFFALRNIKQGEHLGFSYINCNLPHAARLAKLEATYSFRCACTRCRDTAGEEPTAPALAMCTECVNKILQPCYATAEQANCSDADIIKLKPPLDGRCPCCKHVIINACAEQVLTTT